MIILYSLLLLFNSCALATCDYNAFFEAAKNGEFQTLEQMMNEQGCDPNKKKRMLKDDGVSYTCFGAITPLYLAVYHNRPEACKTLFKKGANVKKRYDLDERTVAQLAALRGNLASLKVLFESGKCRQDDLLQCLPYAARSGQNEIILYIMQHINVVLCAPDLAVGSSPVDPVGFEAVLNNALFRSIQSRHADTLALLHAYGAQIHGEQNKVAWELQEMPLLAAAYFGCAECVEYLLEQGVSVNRTNGYNRSALDLANAPGHDDYELKKKIKNILIKAGGRYSSRI